ncbi:MAG: response regulator transcription factor [Candidatus Goldbacteria bacterium]|nr:response regulator transcription factor [Candidatus Goldiibacteriota bacterium]
MEELIAIVDDEEDIAELVAINLQKEGFKTKEYGDGKSFLKSLVKVKPALVILDLMMPEIDGLTVCKTMKKDNNTSDIPIIMLTAKSSETDKVLGLELGADDYVTKPFSPRELTARVKAVLRRPARGEEEKKIKAGMIEIDTERHKVSTGGKTVNLTATEFNILKILVSKRGRVFSREQILDGLWGDEKTVVDRTIDVHIKHLREKLGAAGKMITNIRGVGYKMEE